MAPVSVSAITRYPVARVRAGLDVERFQTAARTAFIDEMTDSPGDIGLLFVAGETEPELVINGGNTAVSLSPLVCGHNVVSATGHGSVFLLSDMEWDGLRPRMAGYIIYSSVTSLIINIGDTVMEFTLDQDDIFRLTDSNVSMPRDQEHFSVNLDQDMIDVISEITNSSSSISVRSSRDCLLLHVHQLIKTGGVVLDTSGSVSTQFLLTPVSIILTRAGGLASNGSSPISDLKPKYQNDTSPFYLGDTNLLSSIIETSVSSEQQQETYYP